MRVVALLALGCAFAALSGCEFGVPPDPNERVEGAPPDPESLYNELDGVWLMLQDRVGTGEITHDEAEVKFNGFALDRLSDWDPNQIPPDRVWLAGQVFRSARRWDDAQKVLRRALQQPMNDEQRASSLMGLAVVEAELGNVRETELLVGEAGQVERPYARRVVLPEVLEFIVPALARRTSPDNIFRIVENAISIHLTTSHPAANSAAARLYERQRNELAASAYEVLSDIRKHQGRLVEAEELAKQAEGLRS